MMLSTLLPVTLFVLAPSSDTTPAAEQTAITIAPCAPIVVRTTWLSERRGTVRTTTDGVASAPRPLHVERHLDRALEVASCRNGVPQRLRVRYAEAFTKALEPDSATPTYATEHSPLDGRTFEIAQVGEVAQVLLSGGSAATPAIGTLVLEAECVGGGAVPLPGDAVARALGADPRERGTPFEFDGLVARDLLGGGETGECAATFTYLGTEASAQGRPRARFEVRIVLHAAQEGALARDADLRGSLLADAASGRPVEFEVQGAVHELVTTTDAQPRSEVESSGTWRVKRAWDWR